MTPAKKNPMGIVMRLRISPAGPGRLSYQFLLAVNHYERGSFFISHPFIEAEIERENIKPNRPIGNLIYIVDTGKKTVSGAHIDPIGHYPLTKKWHTQHGRGLESEVELRAARFLTKIYPRFHYTEHPESRQTARGRTLLQDQLRIEHVVDELLREVVDYRRRQKAMPPRHPKVGHSQVRRRRRRK